MQIEEILQRAIEMDAADIFIVAGLPVTFKCDGHQVRLSGTGNLPAQSAYKNAGFAVKNEVYMVKEVP